MSPPLAHKNKKTKVLSKVSPSELIKQPALSTAQSTEPSSGVSILPISQATTATFTDLYFRMTFLIFIQHGSKKVICPKNGELIGDPGDLMIFPVGSVVTMENRSIPNACYRAESVCFTNDLVDTVFTNQPPREASPGIQLLRAAAYRPFEILSLIKETLNRTDLPPPIKRQRLLEPLIWLRHNGVHLPTRDADQPWNKVRRLIETDVSQPWRINDVATHFAMSEATFRRWLTKSGTGFAQILLNTRLEKALTLLQTSDLPNSQIALECGFQTPSHFSDSFRKRFGIMPKLIRKAEK